MLRLAEKLLLIASFLFASVLSVSAADLVRELKVLPGQKVEIVNRYGRVGVHGVEGDDKTPVGNLTASSAKGVEESEIKTTGSGGHVVIAVISKDPKKRIDLVLELPERCELNIETVEGAVEIDGNFASIDAKSDTGTIAVDVPDDDVKYAFLWTESHPRYLADFDISEVKEKSGGRFEIKGHYGAVQSKRKKVKVKKSNADTDTATSEAETRPLGSVPSGTTDTRSEDEKLKAVLPTSVALNFTTARGIILLNVPESEVMSDLRERPLTDAAKAIVRSGDSLLMEAIRRAAPKYYGDYARSLPPLVLQPKFSQRTAQAENPNAALKTALVRVTDIKNRAIDGLTANDFDVTEGGTPREIVSVERSTAPFNLVLLLDVSGSVENYVNFIRKAARSFVETVDNKDRVSIVIFNDDVKVLSRFTTDKGKLSESLDTFDAGGGTAYYDALAYTVADTLRPLKGDRTAIVILTDGDDNRSFLAFDSLLGSIQESGALIYPLYVPSALIAAAATGQDIDPLRKKYMSLSAKSSGEGERLAKVSGGVYYPITQVSQIREAYSDIVVQLRSAYNITFKSDLTTASGNTPRLKIRSKRENTFTTVTTVVAAQ